jgi:hypothetical protein
MKKLLKNLILFAVIAFCDFAHQAVSQTSQLSVQFNPEASLKPLNGSKPLSNGLRKKDRRISIPASSDNLYIPVVADQPEQLHSHKPLSYVEVVPEAKSKHVGVTVTNSSVSQAINYDDKASQLNYEQGYNNQYLPAQNQLNPQPKAVARSNDHAAQNDLTYWVTTQKPETTERNSVDLDYKKPSKNYVDDYSSPIQNIKQDAKPVYKIASNPQVEVENESVSESLSEALAEPVLKVAEQEINIDQFINKNLEIQTIQEPEVVQAEMQIFTGDQNKAPAEPVVITPESIEAQEPLKIEHIKEDYLPTVEASAIKVMIDDVPSTLIVSQTNKESMIKKILNKGGGLWAAFVEKIKNIKLGDVEDELIEESLI